jgi:branched-chain amino acid transport system permease protein
VIGAVGGMFWVIAQAAIVPGSFSPIPTFYAYAALILGGVARIWGPVVGSMIFWALLSFSQGLINELVANEYIPRSILDANQAGNVRFVLVGLGLMLLLIFRPQGIFGDRREIALQDR